MYICLTEDQKQWIKQNTEMEVIEVKRLYIKSLSKMEKANDTFRKVMDVLKNVIKGISEILKTIKRSFAKSAAKMPPVERYSFIKSLSKCGFDEREMILRVCYARLARSSC